MWINKLLCIIHKFVDVFYKKIVYKETIFINENLYINIKTYLFV